MLCVKLVGYVYIHFESDRSVKSLLLACTHDFSNGDEYYYKISSKRMRSKEVGFSDLNCKFLQIETIVFNVFKPLWIKKVKKKKVKECV